MKCVDLVERLEKVNKRVEALNIELVSLTEERSALTALISIYNKRKYDSISEERHITEKLIGDFKKPQEVKEILDECAPAYNSDEKSKRQSNGKMTYDESMRQVRMAFRTLSITEGDRSLTKRQLGEHLEWGGGKVDRLFTRAIEHGDIVEIPDTKPMRYELVNRFK